MPASFAGVSGFFGRSVRMHTVDNPTKEQLNSFFGLAGTEALGGGFEGRLTSVEGVLFGTDLSAHNLAVESFRALNDGQYYTLVDTRGVTWPNVRLFSFDPGAGSRAPLVDSRGYYTPYRATFRHII